VEEVDPEYPKEPKHPKTATPPDELNALWSKAGNLNESLARHYLEDSIKSFRAYKKLAEKALAQLSDDDFFITLDEEANSVAIIMKHMAGNMLSRWIDFLTTDGEKPDRNRDMEFVIEPTMTRAEVIAYWERGWQAIFDALEPLRPEDLESKITIRGKEHTVVQAINRQLMHYSSHIGQIVFLAKHFRSTQWKSLSVPRNKSHDFNQFLQGQDAAADTSERFDAASKFVDAAEK
jgi:uncharacterized protein DUF1572